MMCICLQEVVVCIAVDNGRCTASAPSGWSCAKSRAKSRSHGKTEPQCLHCSWDCSGVVLSARTLGCSWEAAQLEGCQDKPAKLLSAVLQQASCLSYLVSSGASDNQRPAECLQRGEGQSDKCAWLSSSRVDGLALLLLMAAG